MKTIFVEKCNKEQQITKYILSRFPSLNKSTLFKALRNKDIKVNGNRISKDINVKLNDKIDIYISDELLYNLPKKLDIKYEDENVLVVFKKQGLLSNNEEILNNIGITEPTMSDLVLKEYNTAKLCHRLDRNTCGLLIFAKNDKSYAEMLKAFKNGYITKKYIAYVSNCSFNLKHDVLSNYIITDKINGYSKILDKTDKNETLYKKDIKKIETEYFVLYTNKEKDYAVLNVLIHTGKTHQIRTHLKHISHPIIGDSKYGKNEINKKFKVYKQLLFAYNYSFKFPKDMMLSYLNNINIELDKSYYNNKLGSDIFEGKR